MPIPKCVADYDALRHLDPQSFASPDSCYVFVAGSSDSTNGGLQGFFVWRRESSDADDGGTVIESHAPSAQPKGRWHRVFDGAISVKWFGAKGDTKEVDDGVIKMGMETTLTSNKAGFLSSDVGKSITIAGAGVAGALLATTIAAVVSSTQVTLSATASTSVSAANVTWGTDDTAAFGRWLDALAITSSSLPPETARSREGYIPAGTYLVDTLTNFALGMTIRGAGALNTVLKSRTGATVIEITGKSIHTLNFESLRLDGNGGTGDGLSLHDNNFVYALLLRDVDIYHCGGNGVYATQEFASRFENMFVDQIGGNAFEVAGQSCTTFINTYVGLLTGKESVGYRLYGGTSISLINCTGLSAGPYWGVFGCTQEVTATGTNPPTVWLTGSSQGAVLRIRIVITKGGPRGTAEFRYTIDGGEHWTSDVTTAPTVPLGTTGLTINFQDVDSTGAIKTYATDNVYTSDGTDQYAYVHLLGCNLEDFTTVGIHCKGDSYIDCYGTSFIAAAKSDNVIAIKCDWNDIKRTHIFDGGSVITKKEGTSWANGEPIHVQKASSGPPFISFDEALSTYFNDEQGTVLQMPTVSMKSGGYLREALRINRLVVKDHLLIEGGQRTITSSPAGIGDPDYPDDRLLVVRLTSPGPSIINLPKGGYSGKRFTISDGTGNASIHNIAINTQASQTIRGSTSYIIASDWGSVTLEWNAVNGEWTVIATA
jgi:hypothetical protein